MEKNTQKIVKVIYTQKVVKHSTPADSKLRPSFLDRTFIYQYLNARYYMVSSGIPRDIPTKANEMKNRKKNE